MPKRSKTHSCHCFKTTRNKVKGNLLFQLLFRLAEVNYCTLLFSFLFIYFLNIINNLKHEFWKQVLFFFKNLLEIPHCTGISAYALPFMTVYAHKSHHWFLLQLKWCSGICHLKSRLNLDLSNTFLVLFLHGYDLVQWFQSFSNSLTLFAKRPQTVVIQAGWSSFYFVYTIQSNCVNNMFVIIVLFVIFTPALE